MTSLEFKDYVESFDRWAKTKDQHLVLLIDNAPSHNKQVKLDNVLILFLAAEHYERSATARCRYYSFVPRPNIERS